MKCGECTLCCELLEIKELNKPINELCLFCTNNGCSIHDTIQERKQNMPIECRLFECAYYQMEKVSENLRPDKCKIIFEKISDKLFFGTQDPRFEMTDTAKGQILSFVSQGFSVVISSTKYKNPAIYLTKDATIESVNDEVEKYLNKRNKK